MCRRLSDLICLTVLLGVTGYASADITDDPDLVFYYSFDEFGAVVPDESGNGHDATVQGDVTPTSDKNHRAARFEGEQGPAGFSYLDLDGANFPAEDIPKSAMTLAAWIKCENTGAHHAIFNARASDSTWVTHPEARDNGEFRWLLRAAGSAGLFEIRAGTVTWDEWQHFAGTYDRATGQAKLYINEELTGEQNVSNAKDIAGDWGRGARIGYNVDNARPFTGLMDELYLFRRALAPDELGEVASIPPQLKAYAPDPPDGTKHVMVPLLQWSAGDTAFFHDVYLGTSPQLGSDDLVAPRSVMLMYWHVAPLEPGMTYYWRVDEIEADGVTIHTGDVWSFAFASQTASEPSPYDGAKWVDVEADLMWTAGTGAQSHDVYFGTDRAAVESGDPGTSQGNQVTTTYEPGTLAQSTTYYWRIDEHGEGDVVHEGAIWSFTTVGPGAGVSAEYFRGVELSGAPLLTRVEESINHDWGAGEVAGGLSDQISARWTANLEAPFSETFELITTHEDGVRLWLDGRLIIDNWTDYRATDDIAKVDLIAGQIYLVKMEWFKSGGNAVAKLSWQSPSIRRETIPSGWLQLPVRAASPYPANQAANATQTPILRWSVGEEAAHHDVYLGEDAEAVASADTTSTGVYRDRQTLDEMTYDPGTLEWNKTYYWRIDEVNDANPDSPWTGVVLSFTTADFIVVDDFEWYNDDSPNRIFQSWLDGFGYTYPEVVQGNGTGSTVGNAETPFAEYNAVHSGQQSMPMDYNNVNVPFYSEAERTWATPQDWTINGVDTLTLFVRGEAANDDSQSLYVALEDSTGHVAVVGATGASLAATEWQQVDIPLSAFTGLNVTAIKKIYIGVGDRDNPQPGGAGQLFIDDIWITKP